MTETVKTISAAEVLAQLWEIADTTPAPTPASQAALESCRYAFLTEHDKAQPVCIVGQWLHRQGLDLVPLAKAPSWNGKRFEAMNPAELATTGEEWDSPVAELVRKIHALQLDPEARRWLNSVQRAQDNGTPWRNAVADAWAGHLGYAPVRRDVPEDS